MIKIPKSGFGSPYPKIPDQREYSNFSHTLYIPVLFLEPGTFPGKIQQGESKSMSFLRSSNVCYAPLCPDGSTTSARKPKTHCVNQACGSQQEHFQDWAETAACYRFRITFSRGYDNRVPSRLSTHTVDYRTEVPKDAIIKMTEFLWHIFGLAWYIYGETPTTKRIPDEGRAHDIV